MKANSIILATGATAKKLGLPSEQEFWNKGISACAICDGELFVLYDQLSLGSNVYRVSILLYFASSYFDSLSKLKVFDCKRSHT